MRSTSIVPKRIRLNVAQTRLYELICAKESAKEIITLEQVREIWIAHACRNVNDQGKPYRWNYYHHQDDNGKWHGGRTALDDADISQRATLWLLMSMGALVIKGYLKVIPQVELSTESKKMI